MHTLRSRTHQDSKSVSTVGRALAWQWPAAASDRVMFSSVPHVLQPGYRGYRPAPGAFAVAATLTVHCDIWQCTKQGLAKDAFAGEVATLSKQIEAITFIVRPHDIHDMAGCTSNHFTGRWKPNDKVSECCTSNGHRRQQRCKQGSGPGYIL